MKFRGEGVMFMSKHKAALRVAIENYVPAHVIEPCIDAILDAMFSGDRFLVKDRTGKSVLLEIEDKGDVIPGYNEDGTRFEAYTTYVRWMRDGEPKKEFYQQIPRDRAEATGDIVAFREEELNLILSATCNVAPGWAAPI